MDADTQAAITVLAESLASALNDIAHLKADRWALLEVLRGSSPELHDTFVQLRQSERCLAIPDAASFEIARVSGVLGKL